MKKGHIKNVKAPSLKHLNDGHFDIFKEEMDKQTNISEEFVLEEKLKEEDALKRLADIIVDSFLEEFNYAKTNTR